MGNWALRAACHELKAWHQMGHANLSMAVNISSRQFQQPGFVDMVRDILVETEVSPANLHLELTESVILGDSKAIIEVLRRLKDIGVLMALDDFGTGYSSLSYLRRFPIDIIKIDQSFVFDLIANPEAASIVREIIAMARSLMMKTIAEGVETKQQLDFLANQGCDVIQGFYLSRALPDAEFRSLLGKGPGPDPKFAHLLPGASP
jgi:EAL domain-containing protein (putative c-di-GMP-specific phosphodiesterase class I)